MSKAAGNRLGFYRDIPVFGELLPHIVIRAIIERSREAAFDGISLGLLARKSQKGREYYELVSLVYNAGKRFGYVSQQAFHRIDGIEHLITPIQDFEIEVDDVDPFNCAVCGTAKKLFYRVGRRRYCAEHKQAATNARTFCSRLQDQKFVAQNVEFKLQRKAFTIQSIERRAKFSQNEELKK